MASFCYGTLVLEIHITFVYSRPEVRDGIYGGPRASSWSAGQRLPRGRPAGFLERDCGAPAARCPDRAALGTSRGYAGTPAPAARRDAVYAYRDELDAWWRERSSRLQEAAEKSGEPLTDVGGSGRTPCPDRSCERKGAAGRPVFPRTLKAGMAACAIAAVLAGAAVWQCPAPGGPAGGGRLGAGVNGTRTVVFPGNRNNDSVVAKDGVAVKA